MKKFLLIAALYVIPAFAFGALGGVIGHSRSKTIEKQEPAKCTCDPCKCKCCAK